MEKGFTVLFQESHQPFKDVLIPAKRRTGYVEGVIPVIPIYFYRYIGIPGVDTLTQDNYYNDLFSLDNELSKHSSGYVKIEGHISMPTNEEIDNTLANIHRGIPTSTKTLKDKVVTQVIQSKALEIFNASAFNKNVLNAFDAVMDLYMRNERNINESKAENFVLKIIVWLRRYALLLNKEKTINDIPKVLFYGNIKAHEVYFLTLLALTGIDILYIHTDKSKIKAFLDADKEDKYIKQIELPESNILESFPATERTIRKSTVAYNASQQIQEVLYGADVGLFKARQYEEGVTKPVTLKTTFDELKILWHEEAKIRPEFEVKDEKVYVPNLFAKVNGITEDVVEYWRDFHNLLESPHVVMFKDLPFTNIRYSKQELYSSAYLFNQEGYVDKESLFASPVYKLQHLKQSIQEFIVFKINELLSSKIFIKEIDERMRLKILMTIITMEDSLLRLIKAFDYTGNVPKILVYSGYRHSLSEDDVIIMSFFHLVGADIVIFTPTNYNNIEQWVKPEYITFHQLPSVQFDMEFQVKPLKEKGFKNFFTNLFK